MSGGRSRWIEPEAPAEVSSLGIAESIRRSLALRTPARRGQPSGGGKIFTNHDVSTRRPMKRARAGAAIGVSASPAREALVVRARSRSPEHVGPSRIVGPEGERLLAVRQVGLAVKRELDDHARSHPNPKTGRPQYRNVAVAVALVEDERDPHPIREVKFIAVSGADHNSSIPAHPGYEIVRDPGSKAELVQHSGIVRLPDSGHDFPRDKDSEVKIAQAALDWFDRYAKGRPGRLIVYSDRDACVSCQNVMTQLAKTRARADQSIRLDFFSERQADARRISHFDGADPVRVGDGPSRVTLQRSKVALFEKKQDLKGAALELLGSRRV